MPNIKLIIEYDGSKFHGWQQQPGLRTIQSEMQRVLEVVLREKIAHVQASGRTDEGVHAKRQVCNFRCESMPDLVTLRRSISSILKNEVAVHEAEVVGDRFHSLKDAVAKTYRYTIYNHDVPPVLDNGRVWLVHRNLNIQLMKVSAQALVGSHDFKSFQGAKCGAPDTVKEIFESRIEVKNHYVIFTVTGSGFLKHMVRNIVGTMVDLSSGEGRLMPMAEIIAAKSRAAAGMTAPSWGLCLERVWYDTPQVPYPE